MSLASLIIALVALIGFGAIIVSLLLCDEFTPRNYFDE